MKKSRMVSKGALCFCGRVVGLGLYTISQAKILILAPPHLADAQPLAILGREGAAFRLLAVTIETHVRRGAGCDQVERPGGGVEDEAVAAVVHLDLAGQVL